MKGRAILSHLDKFYFAPNDVTKASLIDALASAKQDITELHPVRIDDHFNSMTLMADEWGVLLQSFEGDMIPTLTTLYDCTVMFDQWRRTKELKIKIERPQLNILAGATPSTLMNYMPDYAWDQGFTSRLILVYSGERTKRDHFAVIFNEIPNDLIHDLKIIHNMYGEFELSEEWRNLVNKWRLKDDENPKPSHPKLIHYNARRAAHVYKLSMVSAASRSDDLILLGDDFRIALGWLHQIEKHMPEIFTAGTVGADARIMDQIQHFIEDQGKPVTEHRILRYASNLLPAHTLIKVLHVMQVSNRLRKVSDDPITYVVEKHRD